MFKKILDLIKNNKDEVVDFGGEYELLIKNERIIDCSNEKAKYNFDTKVGIYQDTYRYLTAGFNTVTQAKNLQRLLSVTSQTYWIMLAEDYAATSSQEFIDKLESENYQRVQHLYEVDEIKLPQGKTSDTFCINFMVRPNETSYLVIGKKPKGKITRAERIEAVKNHARKWEDFKHL